VQEVKRVLTYNPSLAHQKQARDGHTPLHVAAATGNLAIVRELLQAGARCQETDSNLEVPLHIACFQVSSARSAADDPSGPFLLHAQQAVTPGPAPCKLHH
jgi:hypothetical protein